MKILTLMIAVIVVIQLSACNTMRGVGKDVEKSGEAIQKSTNQLANGFHFLTAHSIDDEAINHRWTLSGYFMERLLKALSNFG